MNGIDELYPCAEPAEGWARTPAELLRRAGAYGPAILADDQWGSVLAWLNATPAPTGLRNEHAACLAAVLLIRTEDLFALGHPGVRARIVRPSPVGTLEPAVQADVRRIADETLDDWRIAGGSLSAAMIESGHQFALAASDRDARRAAA